MKVALFSGEVTNTPENGTKLSPSYLTKEVCFIGCTGIAMYDSSVLMDFLYYLFSLNRI